MHFELGNPQEPVLFSHTQTQSMAAACTATVYNKQRFSFACTSLKGMFAALPYSLPLCS